MFECGRSIIFLIGLGGNFWGHETFFSPLLRMIFLLGNSVCKSFLKVKNRTWGAFLEGPEKFSHPESHSEISNYMI